MSPKKSDTDDHAAIAERALQHWNALHDCVVDMRGRSIIADLGSPPDRPRRLAEFRLIGDGVGALTGAWLNVGAGQTAGGDNLIDLVAWLGNCDREIAVRFLRDKLASFNADASASAR